MPDPKAPPQRERLGSAGTEPAHDKRRLASDVLLAGGTEVEIEHGTSIYRLRLTSLGKLILTK